MIKRHNEIGFPRSLNFSTQFFSTINFCLLRFCHFSIFILYFASHLFLKWLRQRSFIMLGTCVFLIIIPRKAGYCNHLRVSVCLFVCLFVSRISKKRLVGFWWKLASREVMIIGRPSSKLGVIRIEIRIWDPDNCFSWTTGRIFGSRFQSDPG